MSEHKVKITWINEREDFSYKGYDRTHKVEFENGKSFTGSAAPEYMGDLNLINPEEELGAAISSCHMMSFLFEASRKKFIVENYEDSAIAILEKNEKRKMAVTKMYLNPKIKFKGENIPTIEELNTLHNKAHDGCFIANSVLTEIIINPII